jgi:pimeloyl-ACP methyl ester carboxylesterase
MGPEDGAGIKLSLCSKSLDTRWRPLIYQGMERTEPLFMRSAWLLIRSRCETLDTQTEPVILVGHSVGGIVISQVAEESPEKFQTLVYFSALLAQNGESLFQLSSIDSDSLVLPNLIMNEEQGYLMFKEDAPLALPQQESDCAFYKKHPSLGSSLHFQPFVHPCFLSFISARSQV